LGDFFFSKNEYLTQFYFFEKKFTEKKMMVLTIG